MASSSLPADDNHDDDDISDDNVVTHIIEICTYLVMVLVDQVWDEEKRKKQHQSDTHIKLDRIRIITHICECVRECLGSTSETRDQRLFSLGQG